jgi:hypothetical protein
MHYFLGRNRLQLSPDDLRRSWAATMSDSIYHNNGAGISLTDMHRQITALFDKYDYKWITREMPIDKMRLWALSTERRLSIPHNKLSDCVSEFYWAVSDAQMAIGHALWAHQSCISPKGASGVELCDTDIPKLIGLGEVYYWHHFNYSYECIYRAWERICSMLVVACYPDTTERLYFNGLVTKLRNDHVHQVNPGMRASARMAKYWNKIARIRNVLSHKSSSHFGKIDIRLRSSSILGPDNQPIMYYYYSYPNLLGKLKELKEDNHRFLVLIIHVKEFIDHIKVE